MISQKSGFLFLALLAIVMFIFSPENRFLIRFFDDSAILIEPVAVVKPGNRWIVVTSISTPTEDVKRLSTIENWNLVVVADIKTPNDWNLPGVHFLSIDIQRTLPFRTITLLPFKSYTRKNIGYLYAISQGAEWIYDTDDDNKPYGLGLNQFDYGETVSGIRYQPSNSTDIKTTLFNPYRFFGRKDMWPRGFPLEYIKEHTNGVDRMISCERMKRAAVQQGLVHHDPDVDAIYRLQHADPQTGLNERFNKFAPPITLSSGTYSPWNSQNTLFHKSAFHTLLLPTTVSFRTTDIWRSYFAQKILQISGLSVSFVPVNAVQFRNAHDYLKDFKDEKQVYANSGKIVEIINDWNCSKDNIVDCMIELANIFVEKSIWEAEDANLVKAFVKDLKSIGFIFPSFGNSDTEYVPQLNESSRDVNCRRVKLDFELDYPEDNQSPALRKAEQKIEYFGDIASWCEKSAHPNLTTSLPSPNILAETHAKVQTHRENLNNVLIITNNYEWKWAIGFLQRMYQPYFGFVVFCGSFNQSSYSETETDFPPIVEPFSYIHINSAEMHRGYYGYQCLTLTKELRLNNVRGYFMLSDDAHFNIWQQIDLDNAFHLHGVGYLNSSTWWNEENRESSKRIIEYVRTTEDQTVKETWDRFETGLRDNGYIKASQTAVDEMLNFKSRSVSDFFYVPSSEVSYYANLMRIFYKFELFHELAINKFLRSVLHNTSKQSISSYLWNDEDRKSWAEVWNSDFVALHPIKLSEFSKPDENRRKYCSKIIQVWRDILFGRSTDYTTGSEMK